VAVVAPSSNLWFVVSPGASNAAAAKTAYVDNK
jgi:hypothetical protein